MTLDLASWWIKMPQSNFKYILWIICVNVATAHTHHMLLWKPIEDHVSWPMSARHDQWDRILYIYTYMEHLNALNVFQCTIKLISCDIFAVCTFFCVQLKWYNVGWMDKSSMVHSMLIVVVSILFFFFGFKFDLSKRKRKQQKKKKKMVTQNTLIRKMYFWNVMPRRLATLV